MAGVGVGGGGLGEVGWVGWGAVRWGWGQVIGRVKQLPGADRSLDAELLRWRTRREDYGH